MTMSVVYLGPEFTFSHIAALTIFPKAKLFYEENPCKVFEKVTSNDADYGILPVENSTTGAIPETFHLLLNQDFELYNSDVKVQIVKEIFLPIRHNLLAKENVKRDEVKTLYTHRQPRLQCYEWLNRNLPNARIEYCDSTATAGEKLAHDSKGTSIGSSLLAQKKNFNIIASDIQDDSRNVTRFVVISSKNKRGHRYCNKTTMAIIIPDKIGTLENALGLISLQNISLLAIRTLPSRASNIFKSHKDWFILDVSVGRFDERFQKLSEQFDHHSNIILSYKILGSYPSDGRQLKKPSLLRKPKPSISPEKQFYIILIKKGEGESVEFKSSLRYDFKTSTANAELAKAVARTLCGFMNSNGGCLFIGIQDNGEVIGIEHDINITGKKNEDSFLLDLYQLVCNIIGKEYSQYVHTEIINYKGKRVCCIKIDRSSKPAWLNNETFCIRTGSATRPLNTREATEYISTRFR